MPDSKALDLIWDVEKDCFKVYCNKNLTMPARLSRFDMLRFLAGHFDPLSFIAPYLWGSKLVLHSWTDSRVALKCIVNPKLHLPRFVKRRVDKIHRMISACDWNYVQGSLNPADVGTREGRVRNSDSFALCLIGHPILLQGSLEPKPVIPDVVVRSASINVDLLSFESNTCLDRMIESAPDLYTLKKACGISDCPQTVYCR